MKTLELTTAHQEKLLEMFIKLFKDHLIHFTTGNSSKLSIQVPNGNNMYKIVYIDWLEFVMFHLAEKIYNPNPTRPGRGLKEKFLDFYWNCNLYWAYITLGQVRMNSIHPIDYLYKEFKNETRQYRHSNS